MITPYRSGRRKSKTTGQTIYIYEFTIPLSFKETPMDTLETFISTLVIKALHKSAPNLTADDDAKATKAVQDFVSTAMDLAAVYFALRNAKK